MILGVILGNFLPGFAFNFAPIASTLLFALLFVTLVDIDLKPKHVGADALVEGVSMLIFGYLAVPLLILVLVRVSGVDSRLAAAPDGLHSGRSRA